MAILGHIMFRSTINRGFISMSRTILSLNLSTMIILSFGSILARAESFPSVLECTSESGNPVVQSFKLFDLNTTKPRTTLDASFDIVQDTALEIENNTTYVNANNGCDNSYEFAFFSDELIEFKKGNTTSVTALLRFYNSESPDPTEMEPSTETVLIHCK